MAFPVHSIVTKIVQPGDGFGASRLSPDRDVIAGEVSTWQLTYTVGDRGLADGATIRIRTDSDTDWGTPQFLDSSADDFASVSSPDGVHCNVHVGGPKSLSIRVSGRVLAAGEKITLTLGDTSGGGPGSRAQTFLETIHTFLFEVDVAADGEFVILGDSPQTVILGGDATRLVVVAPSQMAVGQPFRVVVKAEDQWGNSSSTVGGNISLSGEGIQFAQAGKAFDQSSDQLAMHRGVIHFEEVVATEAGILHINAASDQSQLTGRSNPISVTAEATDFQLQWADPHGGQVGSATKIADFFRYARDVSNVQFVGYQRNADVVSPHDWEIQQAAERELFEPGRFIPLPGFEWSGRTPEGGHHNVYFRRHDQPIRRNPPAEAPTWFEPETALPHIRDVYHHYRNTDTIITAHVGGEHSNLTWHDPTLEPGMEISSSHGSFDWAVREILERGYQMGFLGGSDCYTGRPGDDRPGFQSRRYAKSALTGIYTSDISLDSFFEAMRARRIYATTGARMIVKVDSNGHWMGENCTTKETPKLSAEIIGTAPIASVEVYRGLERIHEVPIEREVNSQRLRLTWSGASRMSSYSGIIWDGNITLSNATIGDHQTLRFDSPRSTVSPVDDSRLSWHAWGCGYPMGVLIDFDGSDQTTCQVAVDSQMLTGPMFGAHGEKGPPRRISFSASEHDVFSASIAELKSGPKRINLGVLDRWIELALDSQPTTSHIQFEISDSDATPGTNSYWIKVIQSDLEMAWTSPLYIDYEK